MPRQVLVSGQQAGRCCNSFMKCPDQIPPDADQQTAIAGGLTLGQRPCPERSRLSVVHLARLSREIHTGTT
jgi:hypothetical protein